MESITCKTRSFVFPLAIRLLGFCFSCFIRAADALKLDLVSSFCQLLAVVTFMLRKSSLSCNCVRMHAVKVNLFALFPSLYFFFPFP